MLFLYTGIINGDIQRKKIRVWDIVMVKNEALVPCKWSLGRIIEVHKGKDDLV